MPLELGGAFTPRRQAVVDPEPEPPSIEDLRSEQLLVALSNLQDALNTMPAPVINVAEPDLSAIVQAVTQLKGSATAEEIALAVREVIDPSPQPTIEPVLTELAQALKTLDFRLKGIGNTSGGGTADITSNINRLLGKVDVTNFPATQQISGNVGLNAGQNIIGAVSPSLSVYAAIGQIWVTGGIVSLSSAAPEGSLLLENPANSGKSVTIVQWSVYAQTGSARARYFRNATSTGTLITPFQTNGGGAASVTTSRLGVGVLTGGTEVPSGHMTTRDAPLEKQIPLTLQPGSSYAIEVVGYGLSATATDFGVSAAFREA